jgi:hypothetical protein
MCSGAASTYPDVTENLKGIISATQIAEEIRARISAETELTASAGVFYNILRQTCLGLPQAGRALRYHARDGAGIR